MICSCRLPPVPFEPTASQKAKALGHIRYEIGQLLMSVVHGIVLRSPIEAYEANLLIESKLVHIRNLIPFFEREKRNKIFDGSRWVETDSPLSQDYGFSARRLPIPEVVKDRLNKQLSHLSYSRTEGVRWDHDEVIAPVLKRAEEFTAHVLTKIPLPEAQRAAWDSMNVGFVEVRKRLAGLW